VVWTRNPFGAGEVRSLVVEDLENDGQLEIIAGSANTSTTYQVNVFEPNGAVRSGWPARRTGDPGFGAGLFNENLAVADMNGDGFKEVFAPTASQYITALDRNGAQLGVNSVYAPRAVWSQVGVGVDNAVDLRGFANCGTEHRPNFENSAPVVADVNGDGIPEVIVVGDVNNCATNTSLYQMPFIFKVDRTRWSGSGFDWTVIPSPGPGSAPLSVDYGVIETAVPNPVVVDLDGDGFKEILYPSYDGKLHAYWLDKTEHGSWPYTVPSTGASGDDFRFASEPAVVDLNNDGHPEVIFTSWPKKGTGAVGQLIVLSYLGQELYRVDLPAQASGDSWNGGLGAPTVANIDADPDLEVVVGTSASGVVAYDLPNSANARVLWGTGRGSYRRTGTPP
jgi:VCBS repeat protein